MDGRLEEMKRFKLQYHSASSHMAVIPRKMSPRDEEKHF